MPVWQIALAAFGGLLVGLGLGLFAGRRGETSLRRRLTVVDSGLRRSVIPVLEARANSIGLPVEKRSRGTDDPLQLSIDLSGAIRKFEEGNELPFSDTIQAEDSGERPAGAGVSTTSVGKKRRA